MEQVMTRMNRRSGWSDYENRLLWETADEAQQQGLPLKAVFERISEKTGRRPNSGRAKPITPPDSPPLPRKKWTT